MTLYPLTAISPIDGRYHAKTKKLAAYFSEFGLIRYRVQIEVEYFIALSKTEIPIFKNFPSDKLGALRAIYLNFTEEDANWIKNSEKTTNHDVKAIEYFLKDKMKSLGLESFLEYIHFGLTSQDINNTAIPLSLKEGIQLIYLPLIHELTTLLNRYKQEWKNIPMLAKTHGQSATPTRLGK